MTDYFLTGPQQATAPDGQPSAGTRVMVIQEAGSYSLIRTVNNLEAYVLSESLLAD